MSITQVLKFGRTIGLDNFSQLKGLARTIQSGQPFKYNLHLNINQAQADEFTKLAIDTTKEHMPATASKMIPNFSETIAQIKKMFPVATAKENKSIIDVGINRYGAKSGSISYKASSVAPSGEVVASADAKILGNSGSIKARAKASVPEQNYAYDIEYAGTTGALPDGDKIAKAIKLDVKDGLFTAKLPKTKSGGVTIAADVKSNEALIDEMVKNQSGGYITSAKDMVNQFKQLNPEV